MPTNAVRLRRGDLDETLAAVGIMKASLRRDGVVIGQFARRPTIRGVPLEFSPSNAPVRPIDVRARVAGCDLAISQIFLDPVPMVREHGAAFVQEVDRLDRWLGPVLAHEIEHVLQKISGEDDMLEAVREAHALSKAAMSSRGDLSAYLAYLGHPLEVAAHAAQLAVEVMITAGNGLDGAEFNAAAEASDLHAHVQEEARGRGASADDGAILAGIWAAIVEEADSAYSALRDAGTGAAADATADRL